MTAPQVSGVKIRLIGDDADVAAVAEALALLPALTQGRIQLGEVSAPYPNRRGPGARIYVDAYVVDDPPTATAQAGDASYGEIARRPDRRRTP